MQPVPETAMAPKFVSYVMHCFPLVFIAQKKKKKNWRHLIKTWLSVNFLTLSENQTKILYVFLLTLFIARQLSSQIWLHPWDL